MRLCSGHVIVLCFDVLIRFLLLVFSLGVLPDIL